MASNSGTKIATKTDKASRLVLNISETKYAVVRFVGRKVFNWKLSHKSEDMDWDVMWSDNAVEPEKLAKMKPYQKINHFPGMYALARKNHLARNLGKMQRVHPEDYSFFPRTWLMPAEQAELRLFLQKSKGKTLIVKPEASCQGRGIFLAKRIEDISALERYVVQQYISKPLLLDDYKFDLRIYVLITGCCPLRIFVHEEGLARLATEKYVPPNLANLKEACMHLTNYAVNKSNPNFVFNTSASQADVGHKRSLSSTLDYFRQMGYDVPALWRKIYDMVIKTLVAVQPALAHTYRSCQPEDYQNAMCFELLGLDILLDSKFRPYLLEVNHSPSFTADTPLDRRIKRKVVADALTLMNIDGAYKPKYLAQQKSEALERTLKGRSAKQSKIVKEQLVLQAVEQRNAWEATHSGGFTKVFPKDDSYKYDLFQTTASAIWNLWTGSTKAKARSCTPQLGATARGKTPIKTEKLSNFKQQRCNSQLLEPEDASPTSPTPPPNVFARLSRTPARATRPIAIGFHYQHLLDPSDMSTTEQAERLSRMYPNFHILLPPAPPKPSFLLSRTLQYLVPDDRSHSRDSKSRADSGAFLIPRSVTFTPIAGLGRQYV